MMTRTQELCRKLRPVIGTKIDRLWAVYLAESDADGKADIEQTLELLAAKHLGASYAPDRSPFPPPSKEFAGSGEIPIGTVAYGGRALYPFALRARRLKEHLLIAGRSGSGKTNLAFVLMQGMMRQNIKVLALDWKRGYRDLLQVQPDLRVYTIGRTIAPFRINPFIPPPGCEPEVWIKLIVDVIANAYLGGEGVISLLVAGLDHLYSQTGVFSGMPSRWPTVRDLLGWLRGTKLKGRAALWQASAERILLAMTYGEFAAVLDTQDNADVRDLLDHNVVLEMDGLSSASDRVLFSEALTLYLYRCRLVQGPRDRLTNIIILEEAHHLLHATDAGTRETVLETSIRMIRQYGIGYMFVDQSASLLSKVAFANSYATLALSQKLRSDVQVMSGAMNLTDEQRESLSTLAIGTAVVRLADEHPEPFLIHVPRCPIREGAVTDDDIRQRMNAYPGNSIPSSTPLGKPVGVPPVPSSDKNNPSPPHQTRAHPPIPEHHPMNSTTPSSHSETHPHPPPEELSREAIRFLADVAAKLLSTTVTRYQRLHLSRRKGNAIRTDLAAAGLIEAVTIATRSGQVVLYQLTDAGRTACGHLDIDPGPPPRTSLEHAFWVRKVADQFEGQGYDVTIEYAVTGDGTVDLLAERALRRVAIEVETGKSDIKANLEKLRDAGFDRIILVATGPAAVGACQKAMDAAGMDPARGPSAELLTWLDVS